MDLQRALQAPMQRRSTLSVGVISYQPGQTMGHSHQMCTLHLQGVLQAKMFICSKGVFLTTCVN